MQFWFDDIYATIILKKLAIPHLPFETETFTNAVLVITSTKAEFVACKAPEFNRIYAFTRY